MQGYIALHRKLMDSWVSEDPMALALWVRMLIEATHKEREKMHKGQVFKLKPGQFLFGLERWSDKTGISREVIRKRIKLFEDSGMITYSKHPKTSVISIVKWDSYQTDNTVKTHSQHTDNTETTQKQQEYNNGNNGDNGNNEKEDKQKHLPDSQAKSDEFASQVSEVFEFWRNTLGKDSRTKLTQKRSSKIKARLKDGFTVTELCQAIEGCAKSPFHMGQNDTGAVHDDLELICRDDSKVKRFIGIANQSAQPYTATTANNINTLNDMEFN